MKCPYITNTVSLEVDANDKESSKAMVMEFMTQCIEEECAAWEDGKCRRK